MKACWLDRHGCSRKTGKWWGRFWGEAADGEGRRQMQINPMMKVDCQALPAGQSVNWRRATDSRTGRIQVQRRMVRWISMDAPSAVTESSRARWNTTDRQRTPFYDHVNRLGLIAVLLSVDLPLNWNRHQFIDIFIFVTYLYELMCFISYACMYFYLIKFVTFFFLRSFHFVATGF